MKLFITGSIAGHKPGTGQVPQLEDEPLLRAATDIGYEAARANHHVLLRNVQSSNTVDRYVLEGIVQYCDETGKAANVELHLPEFYPLETGRLSAGVEFKTFRYPKHGGISPSVYPWFDFLVATVRAVDRCDIAITLGDGESVRMVGSLAASGRKRVLAIATFGGSSGEVYMQNRNLYATTSSDNSVYSALSDPWQENSAKRIVALAERLIQQVSTRDRSHTYFISYCGGDAEIADHIELLLRRYGRNILRDETCLRLGESLPDSIAAMVSQCNTFLAIGSSKYSKSDWCKNELALAVERFKPERIVLLMTDESQPPTQLASRLRIKASSRDERRLAVERLIGEEPVAGKDT
jgi:hypothetical protein